MMIRHASAVSRGREKNASTPGSIKDLSKASGEEKYWKLVHSCVNSQKNFARLPASIYARPPNTATVDFGAKTGNWRWRQEKSLHRRPMRRAQCGMACASIGMRDGLAHCAVIRWFEPGEVQAA